MNIHGNCELNCGANEEKKKYNIGGLVGLEGLLGLGREVCCCIPAREMPTLPTTTTTTTKAPTTTKKPATEPPHTGNGPSFNDVDSSNGSPPDCYYPWVDVLRCNLNF